MRTEGHVQVALVIDQIGDGGAGHTVLKLAGGLASVGVHPVIITLSDRAKHEVDPSIRVICAKPSPISLPVLRRRHAAREIRRLLVTQAPGGDLEKLPTIAFLRDAHRACVAARIPASSLYLSIRTSIIGDLNCKRGRKRRRLQSWFTGLLSGRNVIACSKGLLEEIERLGIRPRTQRAIYNPYDVEKIRAMASEEAEGVPEEPFLLHIGRDHAQKRHDFLLEAFKAVPTPARLVLMGNHGPRLREMIEAHDLTDRVQQVGYRSNPYPWIRRARGVVCSSDFEGFPNVLVEALIVGTPCVSTDCPTGPAEILAGTEVSRLVQVGDTGELMRSMEQLLRSGERETSAPILGHVRTEIIVGEYLRVIGLGDGTQPAPSTTPADQL